MCGWIIVCCDSFKVLVGLWNQKLHVFKVCCVTTCYAERKCWRQETLDLLSKVKCRFLPFNFQEMRFLISFNSFFSVAILTTAWKTENLWHHVFGEVFFASPTQVQRHFALIHPKLQGTNVHSCYFQQNVNGVNQFSFHFMMQHNSNFRSKAVLEMPQFHHTWR